jgi:hypothetical protein
VVAVTDEYRAGLLYQEECVTPEEERTLLDTIEAEGSITFRTLKRT